MSTTIAMEPTMAFRFRALCGMTCLVGTVIMALLDIVYLFTQWDSMPYHFNFFMLFMMVLLSFEGAAQVIGWIMYQPATPIEDDTVLPTLTAVVPAYNEGKFIRYALSSILRSDYPKHKIHVVVVDDGSADDTWDHIVAMKPDFDAANVDFVAHRHEANKGKRAGIQTGFGLAKGDVIVSLDSDSVLERGTLRNLVAPLVHDPKIGGVAGYLSALNVGGSSKDDHSSHTIVPRLLDVLYDKSGNIPRAAQAQAGYFVSILPGALSAFRAEAVRPLLPGLNTSSFRGKPLRHGEDVELTLGLLRGGWATTYQSNAVVHTTAPDTPRRAFLMFTRWERSSYVYLSMGFLQLAVAGVVKKLSGWRRHDMMRTISTATTNNNNNNNKKAAVTSPPPTAREIVGSLYLLLNLVCTATSNLFLPISCLMQARTIYLYPLVVPGILFLVVLSSIFRNLLFLADAEVEGLEEETTELRINYNLLQSGRRATNTVSLTTRSKCCSCDEDKEEVVSDTDSDSGYDSSSSASRSERSSSFCCPHADDEDYGKIEGAEQQGEVAVVAGRKESGETITVHSRKDRLAWRFQYGGVASVFHMGYISWTSIVALCTLESQSWLTR